MANATKEDWKTKPPPEKRLPLGYEAEFSEIEGKMIQKGIVPEEMEDKWFVYLEGDYLNFHRSWTGALIYWLKMEQTTTGLKVVDSWVNRDEEEYKETDLGYDRKFLNFLIRRMLLNEEVPFPIRQEDQDKEPQGIYQHHLVGRGFPEKRIEKKSFWIRFKKFFRYDRRTNK